MLDKLTLKKSGIISGLMTVIIIIFHLSITLKIIPYNLVNGGRISNFNVAIFSSVTYIIIQIIWLAMILIASEFIEIKWTKNITMFFIFSFDLAIPLTCISIFNQLLIGTLLERWFMSLIYVISLIGNISILNKLKRRKTMAISQ